MFSNPRRTPRETPISFAPIIAAILVLSPWVILTGCSSGTPTSGIDGGVTQEVEAVKTSAWDGFCATSVRISWSRLDSEQTVREIKLHNHLGAIHCGWPE